MQATAPHLDPRSWALPQRGGKTQNNHPVLLSDPEHSITVTTTMNQWLQCARDSLCMLHIEIYLNLSIIQSPIAVCVHSQDFNAGSQAG